MKQRLFIANWKMNKLFSQALDFCIKYKNDLVQLNADSQSKLVICPSFPALFSVAQALEGTEIGIGAQTCSAYERGAYTGQVSAQSLKEVGCAYCIIGHSEQRTYQNVSSNDVGLQAEQLVKQEIIPIICIGETRQEYEQKQAFRVLEKQLAPVFDVFSNTQRPFVIAYEPVWSIGTGIVPNPDYLNEIATWIHGRTSQSVSADRWQLVYGGSVDAKNAAELKNIEHIGGFLIGGASLDFQKLQKIVL